MLNFLGMLSLSLLLWAPWVSTAQAARVEAAPAEARAVSRSVPAVQLVAPLATPLLSPRNQLPPTPSPVPAPALSPAAAFLPPAVLPPLAPVAGVKAPVGTSDPASASPKQDEESVRSAGALFENTGPAPALPPDEAPAWPGRTGDRVRVAGRTYELGEKLGEGTSAWVYRVRGRDLVVKLIAPELKDTEVFGGEKAALAAIAKTDIPHAALRAASADGLVLVKDFIDGPPLHKVGRLDAEQRAGLVELMVKLVRIGHTADLNMGNLCWTKRGWVLVDAGGFARASPWGPIGQYLSKERSQVTGFPAAELLAAVRERLGADSAQWRAVLDSAKYDHQKQALAALARLDASRR